MRLKLPALRITLISEGKKHPKSVHLCTHMHKQMAKSFYLQKALFLNLSSFPKRRINEVKKQGQSISAMCDEASGYKGFVNSLHGIENQCAYSIVLHRSISVNALAKKVYQKCQMHLEIMYSCSQGRWNLGCTTLNTVDGIWLFQWRILVSCLKKKSFSGVYILSVDSVWIIFLS